MKIDFMFTGTFWGIILILFGISIFLRSFDIIVPFFRIIFGLFVIYIGITILSGGSILTDDPNSAIFNEIDIKVTDEVNDDYNIIFGDSIIDLTDISVENINKEIEINTVFGSSEILVNSETPIKFKLSSVFGRATTPDATTITFGDYNYISGSEDSDDDLVEIDADVIFGSMEIKNISK